MTSASPSEDRPPNERHYGEMLVVRGFSPIDISKITLRSAQITGILAPIAASIGVDPIQFAVIFLVGASIGFITPPYGLNLYVASGVTGVSYFRILRYIYPYILALVAVWVLVALVPSLSTMLLPNR